MSLDVYLTLKGVQNLEPREAIFVREDGQMKEITRDEWDARYPGREPVTVELVPDDETVYSANITHNLNAMAREAGLYLYLWRPEELQVTKAHELTAPLKLGLNFLLSDPERFKAFNPPNGWGTYDELVCFVENYLTACEQHPDAEVHVSR